MPACHPRIDIVAGCRTEPTDLGDAVVRLPLGGDAAFWGHYVVALDGRQLWQADYDSLAEAVAGARAEGAKKVLLDDGGRLTPAP